MELSDLKPNDTVIVFDKSSKRIRQRQGEYVSANDRFLIIQFRNYKDTLSILDLRLGRSRIFKGSEEVEFVPLNHKKVKRISELPKEDELLTSI